MKLKFKASHLYSAFPQIFHWIKGTLQLHLTPWLRPFTVSFLYGEHTGQGLPHLIFPGQHSEPIWNAHIPPITIIHQVLILLTHGGMEG